MFEPQDLPGRYGRVVAAIDQVLGACKCPAVVSGGWAVWRHGYLGRVTRDIDIALPVDRIEDFLQTASVSGFEIYKTPANKWPKLSHKATDVDIVILPEGGRPGTRDRPAPTTIPHPQKMGASVGRLSYVDLERLVELKLAAGRHRNLADVIELIRVNEDHLPNVRKHLEAIHPAYSEKFDELVELAAE